MNKKWSSDKVKEAQRWIIKRWPESFTQGPDLRPLSLDIHKELLTYRNENPELSSRVVREVLKRHTTSFGYLYGLTKNSKRYNLENKPTGEVSREHSAWARETLRKKQKLAQKVRKDRRNALRAAGNAGTGKANVVDNAAGNEPTRMALRKRGSDNRSANPVIKYKQPRRKMLKPVAEPEVDLAS